MRRRKTFVNRSLLLPSISHHSFPKNKSANKSRNSFSVKTTGRFTHNFFLSTKTNRKKKKKTKGLIRFSSEEICHLKRSVVLY